ncbi:MAG: hypothetical protein JXR40_01545 [Pontiellaceae bacterium]|nr:hypothetical protein [Pontiellaceae bacterium]
MAKGRIGISLLLSTLILGSSLAGPLSDFENAIAVPEESSSKSAPSTPRRERRDHYHHDDDDSDFELEMYLLAFRITGAAVYGTYRGIKWVTYDWWADPYDGDDLDPLAVPAPPEGMEADLYDGTFHVEGGLSQSFLRFDYRQQYVDHNLSAEDISLEAGYSYGGLYGRFTHYKGAADERLRVEQYYAMLRVGDASPKGLFSCGVGLGGYSIEGTRRFGGPALTIPIGVYPGEWVGIEFRPAWASVNGHTINDYDLSLSLGRKYGHLRLGYRWLGLPGDDQWINGPYAGFSISF